MSPWYALALAPFAQTWALVAAGAATVVEAKLSSWADYLLLVYFCLLASAPYLVLEMYATTRPEQTQEFLARLRTWIDAHTDQLILWLSLFGRSVAHRHVASRGRPRARDTICAPCVAGVHAEPSRAVALDLALASTKGKSRQRSVARQGRAPS